MRLQARRLQARGIGAHDIVSLPAAHEGAPQRHWLEGVAERAAALEPLRECRAAEALEERIVQDGLTPVDE